MSDGQRFYISQTTGFRTEHGGTYEHEYAVVDATTTQTVALFIADRPRRGSEEIFSMSKRGAHWRARQHCHKLNQLELLDSDVDVVEVVPPDVGAVQDLHPVATHVDVLDELALSRRKKRRAGP